MSSSAHEGSPPSADPDPIVHLPVGTFLKHAGGRDASAVVTFLERHSAAMARPAVRAAVTKLEPTTKARFVG